MQGRQRHSWSGSTWPALVGIVEEFDVLIRVDENVVNGIDESAKLGDVEAISAVEGVGILAVAIDEDVIAVAAIDRILADPPSMIVVAAVAFDGVVALPVRG